MFVESLCLFMLVCDDTLTSNAIWLDERLLTWHQTPYDWTNGYWHDIKRHMIGRMATDMTSNAIWLDEWLLTWHLTPYDWRMATDMTSNAIWLDEWLKSSKGDVFFSILESTIGESNFTMLKQFQEPINWVRLCGTPCQRLFWMGFQQE